MTVIGYDTTHNLVANIPWDAAVVLGYDTGTSNVKWTSLDFRRFPKARRVHIDQGGPGSPVLTATVRDVETGAWTPGAAVRKRAGWNVARPTIYCNMSTLPEVLAAGWKGDLWLAKLQSRPPTSPPVVPGCTVVAQQFAFGGLFDKSAIFDPVWPERQHSMSEVQYPAPTGLRRTVPVYLEWAEVAPLDNRPPTGYTVEAIEMNGQMFDSFVVTETRVTIPGVPVGWALEVRIWANGGDIAPPHATITVRT